MTKIEEVFNLFVSKDIDKTHGLFNHPYLWQDFAVATDAHQLLYTLKSNIDFIIDNEFTPIPIDKFLIEPSLNKTLNISKIDFEIFKTEDELSPKLPDVDCDTCNGEGEVEWEFESYNRLFDCPVCDGKAIKSKPKRKPTGNKQIPEFGYVKLNDAKFNINLFYNVIKASKLVDKEIVLINHESEKSAAYFLIGELTILIMPVSEPSGKILFDLTPYFN